MIKPLFKVDWKYVEGVIEVKDSYIITNTDIEKSPRALQDSDRMNILFKEIIAERNGIILPDFIFIERVEDLRGE